MCDSKSRKNIYKNHARTVDLRISFSMREDPCIYNFSQASEQCVWRKPIIARRSRNFHGIFSRSDRPITLVLIVMIWFIRNYIIGGACRINAVRSYRAGRHAVFILWIISWELHAGITREEVVTLEKSNCVQDRAALIYRSKGQPLMHESSSQFKRALKNLTFVN